MTIDVDINVNKIVSDKQKIIDGVQFILDQRILADSNYYIPMDVGTLRDSGILWSQGGTIEWGVEYAKAQYYGLTNKSKDKNPNATTKWFEHAKAAKLKTWEAMANAQYNK